MSKYGISVDIGLPSEFERVIAIAVNDVSALFPNQVGAIDMLAEAAHKQWLAYASGQETPPSGVKIQPRTGQYMRSIQLEPIQGDYGYRLFADTKLAPYARNIENGTSAYDMRTMLKTSKKARVSKAGKRYLIIPFRHGTPNTVAVGSFAMPKDVYRHMSSRSQSSITGSRQVSSPNGGKVTSHNYNWGNRLTLADLTNMGHDPKAKQTQNMVGMVRMKGNTKNAISSAYVTFRVMSEDSEGWQVPARPGAEPAKAVFEWLRDNYPTIMDKALDMDIKRLETLVGFG